MLIDASGVPLAVAVAVDAAKGPLLPAYSSDLNPIEQVFSWLKGKILKDVPQPVNRLERSIGRWLLRLGVGVCRRWIDRWMDICYSIV